MKTPGYFFRKLWLMYRVIWAHDSSRCICSGIRCFPGWSRDMEVNLKWQLSCYCVQVWLELQSVPTDVSLWREVGCVIQKAFSWGKNILIFSISAFYFMRPRSQWTAIFMSNVFQRCCYITVWLGSPAQEAVEENVQFKDNLSDEPLLSSVCMKQTPLGIRYSCGWKVKGSICNLFIL